MRSKRAGIAELIRSLAAKQNPGKEFRFPEILFQAEDDDEVEEDEDSNQVRHKLVDQSRCQNRSPGKF